MINKLCEIAKGIEVVLKNNRTTQAMIDTLMAETEKVMKVMSPENALLGEIVRLDRQGVNLPKELLFIELDYVADIFSLYRKLLLIGEVMEIQGRVYPFDTMNHIKEINRKNL